MYIKERQDGAKTVFEYTPLLIPALLTVTSSYLMWLAVNSALGMVETGQPAWLAALGAVGLLAVAAWFCRREYMMFDAETRTMTWSKWSLRARSGGEVGFDEITHLIVEMTGSDGVLSHRLVVQTRDDSIPMTSHFAGNPDHWEPVAERLRRMIGLKVDDTTNDTARVLIAEGKMTDAVRMLCDAKGMSVAGATSLVQQLSPPRQA